MLLPKIMKEFSIELFSIGEEIFSNVLRLGVFKKKLKAISIAAAKKYLLVNSIVLVVKLRIMENIKTIPKRKNIFFALNSKKGKDTIKAPIKMTMKISEVKDVAMSFLILKPISNLS